MSDPRREAQVFVGLIDAQLIDTGSETDECANKIELQARSNAAFPRGTTHNQFDRYRPLAHGPTRSTPPAPQSVE